MKTYTVHLPAGATGMSDIAERAIFIRDGLAWWALFFPLIWLVWHRLWIALAIFVSLSVVIAVAGETLPNGGSIALVLGLVVNFAVAFEGNDMRRWKLARHGYEIAGIVSGRNIAEAELRFFDETAGTSVSPSERSGPRAGEAPVAPRRPAPTGFAPGDTDVIGLFPRPEKTR